jgi:hypothetical protein
VKDYYVEHQIRERMHDACRLEQIIDGYEDKNRGPSAIAISITGKLKHTPSNAIEENENV